MGWLGNQNAFLQKGRTEIGSIFVFLCRWALLKNGTRSLKNNKTIVRLITLRFYILNSTIENVLPL